MLSRSGETWSAEHLDVVADVADHRHVASGRRPRRGRAGSARRRRRRSGRRSSSRGAESVRGPTRVAQPVEVGERVHVVGEVRDLGRDRRPARRARVAPKALGAARPVERREQLRRDSPSAFVVPSSAATSARPVGGRWPPRGAHVVGHAQGTSALTTSTGPTSSRSAAATAGPWPPPGSATTRASRSRATPAACSSARDDDGRPASHAGCQDVVEHRERKRRPLVVREGAEALLAVRPAKRNDDRDHRSGRLSRWRTLRSRPSWRRSPRCSSSTVRASTPRGRTGGRPS